MKSLCCLLTVFALVSSSNFKTEQLKNERVKTAYFFHGNNLQKQLRQKGINPEQMQLYLQAFKHERIIAVWVKNITDTQFKLLTVIPFCAGSGWLGPKDKEGDKQIPEGFYFINRFHPESKYLLSLGINYPNEADKIRSKAARLGGNIFIHGNCVSIG